MSCDLSCDAIGTFTDTAGIDFSGHRAVAVCNTVVLKSSTCTSVCDTTRYERVSVSQCLEIEVEDNGNVLCRQKQKQAGHENT